MRAVRYHEHGGPEVLQVDEVDSPTPDDDEVLVEIEAAGVNPVDTYFRTGEYPVPHLPFVPGSDLAGVVRHVGEEVERFEVGDRVFGTGLGNGRDGTYAEAAVAPVDWLAHLPDNVPFADGAAMALVGMTAWQAFVHHADVEPAQTVLVHAGSGGVGHVGVQLVSAMGAQVVTTARRQYHERLRKLGADAVFDYRDEDLAEEIVDVDTPDVILDSRVDEHFPLDTEIAAQRARIICIGNAENEAVLKPVNAAKGKELRYQFMSMYNTRDTAEVLDRLAELRAAGDVVPEIARTYELEEAGEAQRAVLEDRFLGKLVIEP